MPEYLVKCSKCGKTYVAKVNREGLCNECKAQNTAISKHIYYEKRKINGGKLISEPQIRRCKECGKRFYSTNSQTVCRMCARKKSIEKSNEYRKDTTYSLSMRIPKFVHEEMKQLASDNSLSLTSLVMRSYDIYKRFLTLPPEKQDEFLSMLPNDIDKKDEKNKN